MFLPYVEALFALAFACAFPWLMVRALAFNAHHTAWRHIRFGFSAGYRDAFSVFILRPLLAVLAHEAGNVAHRHGVQRIIQDSLLIFAVRAVTGDVSGTSELFLGLPVVLTELACSREFEREADRYALDYLASQSVSSRHFARLMRRIEAHQRPEGPDLQGRWANYLSTHPLTAERLREFERAD
jgi:hypothetical protein